MLVRRIIHWGLGIRSTDTEVSRYPYKARGLDIRTTDIETLTPCTDIEVASISVLLGLSISTRSRYRYKGRGLGIGIVRIKLVL